MPKKIEMAGRVFGRLKVISTKGRNKSKKILWLCVCECGNKPIISAGDLRSGRTLSCGCLRKEKLLNTHKKHGLTGTRFYRIWKNIKTRCSNKKIKCYKYYGGRGIAICNDWLVFVNFKNDMYESYLRHIENHKTTTIERKNNNGDYCLENCCWATIEEQSKNKRQSIQMRRFMAVASEGKIFFSNNQKLFATEHNLNKNAINNVLNGRSNQHAKWGFNYI